MTKPCNKNCPTVTGKPYGSAKYCPMAEIERHKSWEEHMGYEHKDYTDCCANFQCCEDEFRKAGLLHVMRDLVEQVPVIPVRVGR